MNFYILAFSVSHQLFVAMFRCFRKRSARMQKELEEACRDTRGVSPEDQLSGPAFRSPLPNNASIKFVSNDTTS